MAHICRLMVLDFTEGIGRFDERGRERYDDYNLESAVIYCEDWLAEGRTTCPVQDWSLAGMLAWAKAKLEPHSQNPSKEKP